METLGCMVAANFSNGSKAFSGQMVVYCDSPMVGVKLADGSLRHWRADMCEVNDGVPLQAEQQHMRESEFAPLFPPVHDPATCWHCLNEKKSA